MRVGRDERGEGVGHDGRVKCGVKGIRRKALKSERGR